MSAEARTIWLDITRLVGRAGRGPLTGIDRVERAWLDHLIRRDGPLRLVCRTAAGFLVLDRAAAPQVARWIDAPDSLPMPGLPDRAIAQALRSPALETALRGIAASRCRLGGLLRLISDSPAPVWLSVGHTNLDARLLARLRQLPGLTLVAMIHDTIPLDHSGWSGPRAPAEFAQKLDAVLAHADLILCPSAFVADGLGRRKGARAPDIAVVPLGVRPAAPRPDLVPPDLPRDRAWFVALGTIEPRKDHALLLDIWAHFHQTLPECEIPRLFILGRRGWRNEETFRRLGSLPFIGQTVFERGALPDGAVSALLSGAAGLLAPSRAEGFGLPAAEAAALGVRVIASDLAVTREILGDWPVYAPAGDLYAWANAIRTMARQAESGQARPAPAQVPGWDEHFNLVFSRL